MPFLFVAVDPSSSNPDGGVIPFALLQGGHVKSQPKTVLQEVFEGRQAIESVLYGSYDLNEVAIARLKNRILADLKIPGRPSAYFAGLHHELGYLLALQNRSGADAQLELAERYGMDSNAVAISRSHIALMSGRISDARKIIESLFLKDIPLEVKQILTPHLVQPGMLEIMMKSNISMGRDVRYEMVAAEILRGLNVKDIELTSRLNTACGVIRENISHPILAQKIFAMEGEGILYRYVVKASIEELVHLNDMILDSLMDNHDGPLDQELTICVAPWAAEDNHPREQRYHVSLI